MSDNISIVSQGNFFQGLKIRNSQKLAFAQSALREGVTFMELWRCPGVRFTRCAFANYSQQMSQVESLLFPWEKRYTKMV